MKNYSMINRLLKTLPRTRSYLSITRFKHHSTMPIEVKPCNVLTNSKYPDFVKNNDSKLYNLIWRTPLQNVLLMKKPWNEKVSRAMIDLIYHIDEEYPAVNVMVSEEVIDDLVKDIHLFDVNKKPVIYTGDMEEIIKKTDLIITLGGDGTILRAVSIFLNNNVPPVLSFAMGTLGFLLPFDISSFKQTFQMVYDSRAKVLHRNRLECHVTRSGNGHYKDEFERTNSLDSFEINNYNQHQGKTMVHAMNDISLHRGSRPHLTSLDIYVDNEFFTTTTGDGIVLSTPTGSTAYSLSAGGSITHPSVPCILLTPINPRSLSFRPIILPLSSKVVVQLTPKNRNLSIRLTIDGIPQPNLQSGDSIQVISESDGCLSLTNSKPDLEDEDQIHKGIWCISRTENDWAKDINGLLGFNKAFDPKL